MYIIILNLNLHFCTLNVREEAGSGNKAGDVIPIYGTAEPKEIFIAPQHCLKILTWN
jgi:hypothetical protein